MKSVLDLLSRAKNKRMLVVFPHPDDESVMAGGVIQRALSLGWQVKVICLTCGERGKNFSDKDRSLPELRTEEFSRAMNHLGVVDSELLTFCDGHLAKERSWEPTLRSIISSFEPGVVIGYDETGVTGHPDHIAVAKLLKRLKKYGAKWQLLAPYFANFPKWMIMKPVKKSQANFVLQLSWREGWCKCLAIVAHDSQKLLRNWWNEKSFWWQVFRCEDYVLV